MAPHCAHHFGGRAAAAHAPPPLLHHLCGSATESAQHLYNRSYTLAARAWPFDRFQLIMETRANTCDMYSSKTMCCKFENPDGYLEPERHVRDAIASFLASCNRRGRNPCRAVDLGANNGWFSSMMLQLGAFVTSVEPSPDFAVAIRDTASLNCWSDRSKVYNARACASPGSHPTESSLSTTSEQDRAAFAACMKPKDASACYTGGWRRGGAYSQISTKYGKECSQKLGLPSTVGGVALSDVLLGENASSSTTSSHDTDSASAASGAPAVVVLDMIKMDGDGPEGTWLREIERLITHGRLRVEAMIVEGSHLEPRVLMRYQNVHGYTFWRLDEHDGRRYITREGWDAYSPPGTFARLDRNAAEHAPIEHDISKYTVDKAARYVPGGGGRTLKPMGDNISRVELEDELFSIRAMRHVWRFKSNLTMQGWVTLLNPIGRKGFPPQIVMTLEQDLTEAAFPAVFASIEQRKAMAARGGATSGTPGGTTMTNASSHGGEAADDAGESAGCGGVGGEGCESESARATTR